MPLLVDSFRRNFMSQAVSREEETKSAYAESTGVESKGGRQFDCLELSALSNENERKGKCDYHDKGNIRRPVKNLKIEDKDPIQPLWPRADNWRLFIFRVVDDTQSSKVSVAFSILSSAAVVVSCVVLLISSLPEYRFPAYGEEENDTAPELDMIEMGVTIFFTIEYCLRLFTASSASHTYLMTGDWEVEGEAYDDDDGKGCCSCLTSKLSPELRKHLENTTTFFSRPLNIIDLVAILPFYLESATGASINLTSLRIGRLIRLVKLFKSNRMIPLLINVLTRSANILAQISALLIVFVLIAACFIFICEQGEYNFDAQQFQRVNVFGEKEPTPFTNIYISMWWAIVTFTTVGYGDMAPSTPAGRAIGCVIIFCSLILFAIPITVVTDIFLQEYNKSEEQDKEFKEGHFPLNPWKSENERTKAQAEGRLFFQMQARIQYQRVHGSSKHKTRWIWWPQQGRLIEKLFLLWEYSKSGVVGMILQTFVRLAIILSAVAITVESLERYRFPNFGEEEGDSAPAFFVIETVAVSIFSVELLSRFVSAPFVSSIFLQRCGYCFKWEIGEPEPSAYHKFYAWLNNTMTIIDIVSTVPYYIEVFTSDLPSISFLRVLRLLRLLRLARLAKSMKGLTILTNALEASLSPLASLGVILIGWTIFASSVMFYCEQGEWNEEEGFYERETFFGVKERSPFRSIPDTFYWMVVTMTTVGYGDLFPTSLAGRILGSYILFISIICLAIPITIVAVNIDKASTEYMQQLRRPNSVADMEGNDDQDADNNTINAGPDSALDFAENLYALAGRVHASCEKVDLAIKPFLGTSPPKSKKEVGFLPPDCLKLADRSLQAIQHASSITEKNINMLMNTELQVLSELPCRIFYKNIAASSTRLALRSFFLEWKSFVKVARKEGNRKSFDRKSCDTTDSSLATGPASLFRIRSKDTVRSSNGLSPALRNYNDKEPLNARGVVSV